MFHLWSLAEQDLLSETISYRLRDTGQGLNRVQAAPKTSRMMHAILNRAQKSLGGWVGSSVIHMGDHNVPNALMFIGTLSRIFFHLPDADIIHPVRNAKNNRQVLTNLPHPPAHLQCAFPTTDAIQVACAARIY
jgi:hypothetical protein